MASNGMMAGMQGVFLVAAELSRRGYIVSTTSRSAIGADLLVTDQRCQKAWSVQVKTNSKRAGFWLTGKKAKTTASPSHVYVFVNLCGGKAPTEFAVVPSAEVAKRTDYVRRSTGSEWYSYSHQFKPNETSVGWEVFGDPDGSKQPRT